MGALLREPKRAIISYYLYVFSSMIITTFRAEKYQMPYMHWETDRNRHNMAQVLKQTTQKRRMRLRREFAHLAGNRQDTLADIVEAAREKISSRLGDPYRSIVKSPPPEDIRVSLLGEYILTAAKMHAAMDIESDVRALRENIFRSPPLHARRTLNQSYYSQLEDTERRDEDQVIRRGTRAGMSIYKTTWVIMVDQLWLYVLEDSKCTAFSFSILPALIECPSRCLLNSSLTQGCEI
jgi:hypothetical protein